MIITWNITRVWTNVEMDFVCERKEERKKRLNSGREFVAKIERVRGHKSLGGGLETVGRSRNSYFLGFLCECKAQTRSSQFLPSTSSSVLFRLDRRIRCFNERVIRVTKQPILPSISLSPFITCPRNFSLRPSFPACFLVNSFVTSWRTFASNDVNFLFLSNTVSSM